MKTRTTLILFIIVLAVAAYIRFYERHQPNTAEAQRRSQNVINFDRDKIDGITIQNGDDRIDLRLENKKWRIESPVKDQADGNAISMLLSDLDTWQKFDTISAREIDADKNKLSEFGVGKPKLRIKLLGKDAPPEILIGKDAALEGKVYVRLENSKLNYDRAQQEVAEHLISQEQFDRTHLDNQIAQQELAEAQWRLAKTTIRAPFGGRVTERFMKLGQHIRPGDQLFTVADFDPLIAKIFLPEKDVIGLKEGREVRITLKASEQTRFRGRIRQISPVVDTATGTVKLTVEATAPPPEVRPGAFVTIDIVRETHPQAVLLPREAVIRELQDAYVFVASAGIAEKRTVSLGLEEGTRIEALSGVKPGEQVIVAGQGGLKQGSPIKVIPAPEASDLGGVADRPVRG